MGREKLFSAPGSVPIKTLEKSCTGKGIAAYPHSPKFLYLHTSRESTFVLALLPGHSQILSRSFPDFISQLRDKIWGRGYLGIASSWNNKHWRKRASVHGECFSVWKTCFHYYNDGSSQELMSTTKQCEGASNYHTLVGPILYRIWHLQNVPYKVAACLHLLH